MKKPPLRVVILAGAADRRYFEGIYGPTWEIWGLNAIRPNERLQGPWNPIRWSRMFNLHRFEHLNRDVPGYIYADSEWSKRNPKVPFYVVDSWHGLLANERLFPLEALKRFPRGGRYHAGSIDMMVAYAVHLGATTISLHGVKLALDSMREEPISARACLEYWCGFAEARGVKILTRPDCDILAQYHLVRSNTVYGYDDVKLVVEQ